MTDTPKFEVIDRRKLKAQEEQESAPAAVHEKTPAAAAQPAKPAEAAGPRLVTETPAQPATGQQSATLSQPAAPSAQEPEPELPPAPTAQESNEQKAAYDVSAQRLEEMARAQNPAMGAQPPVTFEHLIQQFYLSGLIQMGVGTQQGERPQIDILGARSTIDLIGVLAEKTRGNLTPAEDRMLQSVLYELRMMFLEITGMISMPNVPPPPKKKQ
jgi:Domain of unknown function (DUF1844)